MRMLFFAPSSVILKLAMKPSSLRIRAISILSLEAGTSTLGWRAIAALRILVNMSPTGSDVAIYLVYLAESFFISPTGLDHAGNLAGQCQLAETNPAQIELAKIAARAPAAETTVAVPD